MNRKLDVNIYLDSSFSVPFMKFQKMKSFVKKMTEKMEIDSNSGIKVTIKAIVIIICCKFIYLFF